MLRAELNTSSETLSSNSKRIAEYEVIMQADKARLEEQQMLVTGLRAEVTKHEEKEHNLQSHEAKEHAVASQLISKLKAELKSSTDKITELEAHQLELKAEAGKAQAAEQQVTPLTDESM